MSLEVRKYKFEEGDSHDIFELELIPEVVDGVEVYNIQAVATDSTGIVGKSKKLHYGYLSKEMANFLDQRNEFGFANIEKLSLKSPIKYPDEIANLSQKIIIDRHPEAGNAIPQISLDPIKYSDRLEPTITVAIKNFFNVSTADAPIIFKLNDNKLLCDSFYIIDTNDEGTTTIDLNIENNRADMVSINENIDLKLQDQFMLLHIDSLTSKKPYSIALDCTSGVFVTSNVGTFNVNKYDAEVKFKADRVEFSYTTFKVEDSLKNSAATFENRSKDKDKLNSISFLGGNVDILGAAHITTDTKRFIINQQGSGLQDVISFSGESFISAKEQVSIINGEFKGTNKIKSTSKGLTFLSGSIGNIITNSDINIAPKTKKGENEIEVDDLRVSNALLDNIKANALTGDIYNAKITNCEMANGSVIYINRSEPKLPAYFTTIDNLIFKKKGMLFLDSGLNNINKRVITNCVVEEGNFKIFDDGDYKLNNSILSHGEIIINNENREVIISNSNIKGYNKLENISSIDCSILENAEISSSKLIGLKDEMIIDQRILDYSANLAQPKQGEISRNSIITNDIEIL